MRSRLPFLLLAVLLLSVSVWAVCSQGSYRPYSDSRGFCKGDPSWGVNYPLCSSTAACGGLIEEGGLFYYGCNIPYGSGSLCNDGNWGTTLAQKNWVTCAYRCGSQCEADSVAYYHACVDSGGTWENCACVAAPPVPDTTWHCQNSGGSEPGGIGGAPSVALLFRCVDGVCTQTARIAGSCQDWGFCPDGVSDNAK